MDWRSPSLVAGMCSIALVQPLLLPDVSSSAPNALLEQPATQLSLEQLHSRAQSLTVKVLSKEGVLGSGTLIQRQGSFYTVLTSKHVLSATKPPYRLQTPDGRIYQAWLSKTAQFKGNDLALLLFRTTGSVYAVASLGASSSMAVGDEVFAAGFSFAESVSYTPRNSGRFVLTTGQLSLVLSKALSGGYQIGHTTNVQRGMSGGPLLNRRGEVVGINGMHANPLWDAPEFYEDGSEPSPPLQDAIARSSWAVPMETLGQLAWPYTQFQASRRKP